MIGDFAILVEAELQFELRDRDDASANCKARLNEALTIMLAPVKRKSFFNLSTSILRVDTRTVFQGCRLCVTRV